MTKKTYFLCCTVLISFCFLINLISYADDNKCILKVGYETAPPLIFMDENSKKLSGLDVELLEKIAMNADCTIEWVKMPWRKILSSIQSGEILLTTSATKTEERSKYSNYTIPYRTELVKLYVRKKEKVKIKANNLKDFLEQTSLNIGYNDSYEYNATTKELMLDPRFSSRFESVIDSSLNFYKLQGNLIDGILMETLVANEIIRLHGWEDEFDAYDFHIGTNNLSFMVSKKADPNGYYLKTLNKIINNLKSNSEFNNIFRKYNS